MTPDSTPRWETPASTTLDYTVGTAEAFAAGRQVPLFSRLETATDRRRHLGVDWLFKPVLAN